MTKLPQSEALDKRIRRLMQESEDYRIQVDMALRCSEQVWWTWNLPRKRLKIKAAGDCILGYGPEDLEHGEAFWWDRIHPEDLHEVKATLQQCFASQHPLWECEHRFLDAAGDWSWVAENGFVNKWDADGNPVEMVGTTRKREEVFQLLELLEGSEAVVNALSANAPVAFCIRDGEGVLLHCSHQMLTLLGDGCGKPIDQRLTLDEESLGRWHHAFEMALEGKTNQTKVTLALKSGEEQLFRISLSPVAHHSEAFAVLEIFQPLAS